MRWVRSPVIEVVSTSVTPVPMSLVDSSSLFRSDVYRQLKILHRNWYKRKKSDRWFVFCVLSIHITLISDSVSRISTRRSWHLSLRVRVIRVHDKPQWTGGVSGRRKDIVSQCWVDPHDHYRSVYQFPRPVTIIISGEKGNHERGTSLSKVDVHELDMDPPSK